LHLEIYGNPDIHDLAASYACGIAQRQLFIDGNKRVSVVVTELFLNLNGLSLEADDSEIVATWMALAANRMTEQELVAWLRNRTAVI
jgi:death-on-curing protein